MCCGSISIRDEHHVPNAIVPNCTTTSTININAIGVRRNARMIADDGPLSASSIICGRSQQGNFWKTAARITRTGMMKSLGRLRPVMMIWKILPGIGHEHAQICRLTCSSPTVVTTGAITRQASQLAIMHHINQVDSRTPRSAPSILVCQMFRRRITRLATSAESWHSLSGDNFMSLDNGTPRGPRTELESHNFVWRESTRHVRGFRVGTFSAITRINLGVACPGNPHAGGASAQIRWSQFWKTVINFGADFDPLSTMQIPQLSRT
jgi:hypothetical protein